MSFKALKVWRALKRRQIAGCREIADSLGWKVSVVSRHLGLLREQGCAVMHGKPYANNNKWTATNKVPVRCIPQSRLDALKPYHQFALIRLAKARQAKGCKIKPPPVPKPATALEQFWPSGIHRRADSTNDGSHG